MLAGAFDRQLAISRIVKTQWRLDHGLVRCLRDEAAQRVIYDFGAGIGLYCAALNCRGVDGIPGIAELSEDRVSEGNLADPGLIIPSHDLALCLEVAEHIPRQFEQTLLNHLTRQCGTLVLSWATPDQPGEGHCNGREFEDVVSELSRRGFDWDEVRTAKFRRQATISWLRRNVAVYQRRTGELIRSQVRKKTAFRPERHPCR